MDDYGLSEQEIINLESEERELAQVLRVLLDDPPSLLVDCMDGLLEIAEYVAKNAYEFDDQIVLGFGLFFFGPILRFCVFGFFLCGLLSLV